MTNDCSDQLTDDFETPDTEEFLESIREIVSSEITDAIDSLYIPEANEIDLSEFENALAQIDGRLEQIESRLTAQMSASAGGNDFDASSAFVGKFVEFGMYSFAADRLSRPITWKMINVAGKQALLLSHFILRYSAFETQFEYSEADSLQEINAATLNGTDLGHNEASAWQASNIKRWLDEEFTEVAFDNFELNRLESAVNLPTLEMYFKYIDNKDDGGLPTEYAASKVSDDHPLGIGLRERTAETLGHM